MIKSPLPGGAPWRVLAACPALLHNSLNAAIKGISSMRCICPRAEALKADYMGRRRAEKQAERQKREYNGTPSYVANYRDGVPAPDLSKGQCRTEGGRKLVDLYALPTSSLERPAGLTEAHRFMCNRCVVKTKCGGWALAAERPAGEWSGMYGGMTVSERKKIAKARAERDQEEQAA